MARRLRPEAASFVRISDGTNTFYFDITKLPGDPFKMSPAAMQIVPNQRSANFPDIPIPILEPPREHNYFPPLCSYTLTGTGWLVARSEFSRETMTGQSMKNNEYSMPIFDRITGRGLLLTQ